MKTASRWNWVQDKVLRNIWEAEEGREAEITTTLTVRKHGAKRFSWTASLALEIESGVDEICGSATSFTSAKAMAERAARILESDPNDWPAGTVM